jgi:hypothetical protein
MTEAKWHASTDPVAMIRWLEKQGYHSALWEFTIACCRRIWGELPGDAFRRVVEHVEQMGIRDVDDRLAEATQVLDKLERRFRKAIDTAEQAQLNRQLGFGRMVFAFDHQDGAGAARSISSDLVDWADDPEAERRVQSDLLRQLVPDPSQPAIS